MPNRPLFPVLKSVAAGLGLVALALQLSNRKAVKDIQRRLPTTDAIVERLGNAVVARLTQQMEQFAELRLQSIVADAAAGELSDLLLKLRDYPRLAVGAALIAHLEGLSRAHAAAERDLANAREAQRSGPVELMPDEVERLEVQASDLRAELELAAGLAEQWRQEQLQWEGGKASG